MSGWVLPPLPDLYDELLRLVAQVPAGRVSTFGDLATALGDVRAARWIAQALADVPLNDASASVHRVVRKTGDLPAGAVTQRERLLAEGCPFVANGRIDVESVRSDVVSSAQPLRELCDWQIRMAAATTLHEWTSMPATIGGVDLSYLSDSEAIAAYVSIDAADGQVRFSHTVRRRVPFPYIPGYLTFREAPVLLDLLSEVRSKSALDPLVMVDGSGRLHPRRAGIAVALGLLSDVATIGISKHQLCGRVLKNQFVEECPSIEDAGEIVGAVLAGGSKRRTLFVSPGDGIDLASAISCVRAVWKQQRLPLPTYHADRLSREVVRKMKGTSVPVTQK